MPELTQERLKQLLSYDPDTGVFTRLVDRGGQFGRKGAVAGTLKLTGYIGVSCGPRIYTAHRLAWLYMTGDWPKCFVDHINGDRADNRFENLREATFAINSQNQRRAQKTSASGVLGVTLCKQTGRWKAQIKNGARNINLGRYNSTEEAHQAYLAAKRKLHEGCTI